MKTPFDAAMNPQKKNTVTKVVNADWLFFVLMSFGLLYYN
jgi:hypothetical protein